MYLQIPDLKIAEAVYEDAVEKFGNDTVHLEFYNVADQFLFAKDLREQIFRYSIFSLFQMNMRNITAIFKC